MTRNLPLTPAPLALAVAALVAAQAAAAPGPALPALAAINGPAALAPRTLDRLPVRFEPAPEGSGAAFVGRAGSLTALVSSGGLTFAPAADPSARVAFRFEGADPSARVEGEGRLSGVSNYLGGEPGAWRTGVPGFASVRCGGIYPGVDLVVYERDGALEYDLALAPGARADAIRMRVDGPGAARLDAGGDLVAATPSGELRLRAPAAYQDGPGGRRAVASRFALDGAAVALEVGASDPSLPLVVDPVVTYSTFLGGNDTDSILDVKVDAAGNAFVAGYTKSTNLSDGPALQPAFGGGTLDAFVAKLDPTGSDVVFATYLGGSEYDVATAVALDTHGGIYVTGETRSINFPRVGTSQTPAAGQDYVFVTKVAPSGASVEFSRLIGGSGIELATAIAVDALGAPYVTGFTTSADFPVAKALQPAHAGGFDVFLTKLRPGGQLLEYSTFIGGSGVERGLDVAVDGVGAAYVVGHTTSADFPVVRAAQPANAGGGDEGDAFVLKVDGRGEALVFSTFLGGSAEERATSVGLDGATGVYVGGYTKSSDFPTRRAMDATLGGAQDMFVARLRASGEEVVYSTYLGGSGTEEGKIAVDRSGTVYVGGETTSANFPTKDPLVGQLRGEGDMFAAKLLRAGDALVFSTYLGGGGYDGWTDLALGPNGSVVLAGVTGSADFPTRNPAQAVMLGANDGVVVKLQVPAPAPPVIDSVAALGPVFRVKVTGSNFQPGAKVYLGTDDDAWPAVKAKGTTALVLKKGAALEARFPAGQPVRVRVANPDGGEATGVFTR